MIPRYFILTIGRITIKTLIFLCLLIGINEAIATTNTKINIAPPKKISVTIAALEFTGVVQQNLLGAFDLMMADLATTNQVIHHYQVFSPARGAKMLLSGRSDCLIPGSLYPPYYKSIDVIHSESFAKVTYLAFTLANQETITTKAQLHGKVIGMIRDEGTWNYEKRFNITGATYIKVSSLESLVEMLNHRRIDVAIHDDADFLRMTKHLKFPKPNFNINTPMAIDKIVVSCHNNANNRAYLQAISPQLQQIISSGKMIEYYQQVRMANR